MEPRAGFGNLDLAMAKTYDTPSDVAADEGSVMIDGPDGVAVTMTPEAAEETSDRLLNKAAEASGQRHFKKVDEKADRSDA